MAYLAFQDFGGVEVVRHTYRASATPYPTSPAVDSLTALEWSVVAIARDDGQTSLRRFGRLSTKMRAFFNQRNPRLGNERLEALRRMAVLTWHHGWAVSPHEVGAFLDAGFTHGQYELMVDSIAVAEQSPLKTVAPFRT